MSQQNELGARKMCVCVCAFVCAKYLALPTQSSTGFVLFASLAKSIYKWLRSKEYSMQTHRNALIHIYTPTA